MEHIKGMYYKPEKSYDDLPRHEQIKAYVRSFKEPALNICRQLQEAFSTGRYSHIFGVDTSGRIPALMVYEVAKAVAQKQGVDAPACRFLPPTPTIERKAQIIEQLKSQALNKPILFVDDTIRKGTSITDATEIARTLEIPFDVAIFVAYNLDAEHIAKHQEYIAAENVYIGMKDYISDGVFDDDEPKSPVKDGTVNGVERLIGPMYLGSQETVILGDSMYQNEVNIARSTLQEVALEIYSELSPTQS